MGGRWGYVPVCQRLDAEIDIVVCGCGTINHDCADHTITILIAEMRMVPAGSVFSGAELVYFGISRGKSAYLT